MFTDIKSLLALITVVFVFTVTLVLFFVQIPQANLDLVKTFGIALISAASLVIGYYFGSSDGSARKTELLAPPTIIPASELAATVKSAASDAGFVRLPLLAAMSLLGLIFMAGCATTNPGSPAAQDSPQVLAGKSLLAVKSTIVTAATATAALCRKGTLPADTCAQADTAYEQAKPAYDAAVDAYLLMTSQGGDTAAFGAALTRVQSLAANLLALSGGAR